MAQIIDHVQVQLLKIQWDLLGVADFYELSIKGSLV
jgi:hypothetical protein